MDSFRALWVEADGANGRVDIRRLTESDLPAGEVTVAIQYSSVNYKDGLATRPSSKVVRRYPMVPGIDLAGTVLHSEDPRFRPGDRVIATGYELGVSHFGGFSQRARVPGDWLVPLPAGLTLREAMVYGTAGFTAALSVHKLLAAGLRPEQGPVLVTGASGGVGSIAVAILARLGFHVVASTGKAAAHDWLRSLGAAEVISREETAPESPRSLEKERWAGVVDPVGGPQLARILRAVRYGGSVAVSGLTGGPAVDTTVFPFILRGVNLLGVDSVYCPHEIRLDLWEKLAGPWKPAQGLEPLVREIDLDRLPDALEQILRGEAQGRTIVRLGEE
jgi:acrylyl-CoA reductase (NADPH)